MPATSAPTSVKCTGKVQDIDGEPTRNPNRGGCGITFDVTIPDGDPGQPDTWDVKTDAAGKVIQRHKEVTCPDCGTLTYIVKGG